MTDRTVPVLPAVAAIAAMVALVWPAAVQGQRPTTEAPDSQVEIVWTVGCVQVRPGDDNTWWLTRAADPEESSVGVFNTNQVEEAKDAALGSREFQLVGVAEFLDAESLLRFGDRARFTTADQVNATNQLRDGHSVLVKGLLIEAGAVSRINLLAVVGLADSCG